jgi:hypothetical protein
MDEGTEDMEEVDGMSCSNRRFYCCRSCVVMPIDVILLSEVGGQ